MTDERHYETIEMIAATLAHEVKNPLSLIQANIDYIELCDVEHKYSNNYRIIKQELKRTNEMLGGFIELINLAYNYDEEMAIYDIVMQVAENYKQITNKIILFTVSCRNKNLYIRGNAQLFTMALSNIIKNSIEAIEDSGEIKINIDTDGSVAIIKIEDTGRGLSPEVIEKIKNSQSYSTKTFGSGIGINICKQILTQHNGTYSIENCENGGCVVTIDVPLANG